MVSFHASLLPTSTMIQDSEDSLKKRKRDGSLQPEDFLDDHLPSWKTKYSKQSLLDTELHLESPMPSEWQRCLDIKSGQIYYYNTRTHKKTSRDPRSSPEPSKNCMSLDLELNLPCGSSDTTMKHHVADNFSKYYKTSSSSTTTTPSNKTSIGGGGGGAPSWLALEGGDQQQEMVTAVCKKCHMLVMMFKSSPSCPNCKFMHPPNQTPPSLFNRELSLLC
ncbi:uncharacterized protein LOC112510434 [Cynara cardunculus var. scolymus]|uniref:WW domain-containing protein n=1 Tax=Cynara cardunculus var. scolymus TaxID=59895 RepID=A0A103YE10_CYNCS|nr:uncharacterized protein LOC112510434 [Cynara cardunculus var. scolymus]KVI07361.1 WW domain-containing protein [Cynara cardunculus var. scolymus]